MDKKDFRHGEFGEPPIDARKPLLINGLRMSMAREGVLREGCKPSTTPRLRTRVLAPGHGRQVARMDSRWMGDEGAALTGSA